MGEVIPKQLVTNVLHQNERTKTLSSLDREWLQI